MNEDNREPEATGEDLDLRLEVDPRDAAIDEGAEAPRLEGEVLIEEVSIDGMCGVY
ncbi:MAG: mycofactocin precursor MftA [Myxococcota bacterium]